jgi:hypothetical protein
LRVRFSSARRNEKTLNVIRQQLTDGDLI